ncbi:cytochrome P450 [Iamia sp.]|uniref:cytochrome P450 n=1 Tax=Iamia sp. TaxID=2722710 RepID=UPI002CA789E1|nr:cytochrome P450 [Iamia sp.]HXH59425.1 cytochrome P450 [Iamia sp.]
MTDTVLDGMDLTSPDLYAERVPLEEFALLRRTAPVWWNAQNPQDHSFDDGGFWVLSRHADVKAVSCAREGWSAAENGSIVAFEGNIGKEAIDLQRLLLLNMDPPHHTEVRGVISKGCFTPRAIATLEDGLRERAHRIVSEALAKGQGNFVVDMASELPLQALSDVVGFPVEDRAKIFDWSNQMIGSTDPDFVGDPQVSAAELLTYAYAMGEERRACPMGDVVTRLVQADSPDGALSPEEFGYFVLILTVAGNETTRNAITHGMQAFFDHPEQWEHFKAERPATAADEIVRWATPVVAFQRTATQDTEIGGQAIAKGQRVGLFYASANRDEAVFTGPDRFDIGRDPNPHVGFGGGGAHFCIGANLARMEINLIFEAIADLAPDISPVGPPDRLRVGWLNGVKDLPVRYA